MSRAPDSREESDPLAELARLIGQTDPFEEFGRTRQQAHESDMRRNVPPRDIPSRDIHPRDVPSRDAEADDWGQKPIPSWLASSNRGQAEHASPGRDHAYSDDAYPGEPSYEPNRYAPAQHDQHAFDQGYAPQDDYGREAVPLYGRGRALPQASEAIAGDEAFAHAQPPYSPGAYRGSGDRDFAGEGADTGQADPSRYDDVLYGTPRADAGRDAYAPADDARYGPSGPYEQDYGDEEAGQVRPRRTGMIAVAAVFALAIVGTAGAYGYRHYVAGPRSGDPPLIRADNAPTKVTPAPAGADGSSKPIQDRMPGTPGAERVVSREEQPVDINQIARQEPRVVLPAPNQPAFPPQGSSAPPVAAPPPSAQIPVQQPSAAAPSQRTASTEQPKRIKTVAIRGDQGSAGVPAPARPAAPPPPAPTPVRTTPQAAPPPAPPPAAEPAGGPMQLSPQSSATGNARPQRTASAAPAAPGAPAGSYVVQVSSQRSEADAQASYRTLQGKFPSVLGSRAAVVKRVDLGDKGTYYRAVVGPFAGADEASRVCADLKSAGGQCVIQRN